MQARSEEEIRAIEDECIRLDKEGGDVLGYLRSQNYISPGATWWRIQQFRLKRCKWNMTSGRPKEKKEAEKNMAGEKRIRRNEAELETIARTAMNIAQTGISPMTYLLSKGYSNPGPAWTKIKKRFPEETKKLPEKLKAAKKNGEPEKEIMEKMERNKTETKAETAEKLEKKLETEPEVKPEKQQKKQAETQMMTLPAIMEGIAKGIQIVSVSTKHGAYSIDKDQLVFSDKNGGSISLPTGEWKDFVVLTAGVLERLGIIKVMNQA